jgi:hypothetical protein
MVLMFANNLSRRTQTNYEIRRLATDFGVPLITNAQVAELLAESLQAKEAGEISFKTLKLSEHLQQDVDARKA